MSLYRPTHQQTTTASSNIHSSAKETCKLFKFSSFAWLSEIDCLRIVHTPASSLLRNTARFGWLKGNLTVLFCGMSRCVITLPHQLQSNQYRKLSRLSPVCLRLTVFVSSIHLRAVYCATLLGLDDWRVTWPCCFVVCRGVLLRSRINSNPTNIGSFSAYPRPQLYHISYVNALFSEGAEISCLAMFDFISIPFISIFSLISNLSRLKRTLFSCKWDGPLASKLWLRWCFIDQNMYPIQHHP